MAASQEEISKKNERERARNAELAALTDAHVKAQREKNTRDRAIEGDEPA